LIALASDFPEIWMLPKNLKRVTWRNQAPFRDVLSSVGWD